jgi:Na+-transporting NADH:ubiquinone oxidoreductase subunit NqrC
MISDLYVKAQDWPGAAEISERFKRTIPPELLDEKTGQLLDPAQVKQMIEQAVAEYAQSLEAQEKEAKIDTERAKAEQIRAETERDAIETESATQRIVAETLEALRARGGLNG